MVRVCIDYTCASRGRCYILVIMVYIQCLRCEKWFDSIGERKHCDECKAEIIKEKQKADQVKKELALRAKEHRINQKEVLIKLREISNSEQDNKERYIGSWDRYDNMLEEKKEFYKERSIDQSGVIDPNGTFCPKCNKKRPPSYFPSGNKEKICTYCHYLKRRYGYNWYDAKYYPKE